MTGAMAGSTATLHGQLSERLRVITLTINNQCNLQCPHCYLQYDGPRVCTAEATLDAVAKSSAHHIAIVGKEPLVDAQSVAATERLVARCVEREKSVSLVTNGIGLRRLSSEALSLLEWIDVSLDGGPWTYRRYRRGDFDRVIGNVQDSLTRGARFFNALHTISTQNLADVDDMMSVADLAKWNKIIFSPYAQVRNHGSNPTSPVPLSDLLNALRESRRFVDHHSAIVLIGSHAFVDQGIGMEAVDRAVLDAGLSRKVLCVKHDPLLLGYVRVTYDGYVMTPYQSLHPADYRASATPLQRHASVDAAFEYLRAA